MALLQFALPLLVLIAAGWARELGGQKELNPLSDAFIHLVNQKATTWKAGRNFGETTSMSYIKRLMGVLPNSEFNLPEPFQHSIPDGFLFPENFDARIAWSQCPVIKEVRDQGNCGSCWAISSTEVMSDRTCIHSNGLKNFHYSTQDLMSCCSSCGFGCSGGYPSMSFRYWVSDGIVSGGLYNSGEGCKPYTVEACEHHIEGGRPSCDDTEPGNDICVTECQRGYGKSYEADKRRGTTHYSVIGEENIMYELINNGPIAATYYVYEDFLSYKSGVYQHETGNMLGGHAIRVIGYGVENDTPYWLCVNSWNSDWGDNGTFKILKGQNECGIDGTMVTGLP